MSDTQYSVEIAMSGKAKCKRCKIPIEKGSLRIATSAMVENDAGGYNSTSYQHPECFNLPRKYAVGANKMTAEDFVRDVLQDGSESGRDILPAKMQELATAIATTTIKKKASLGGDGGDGDEGDGTSPKAWIASIKAACEKQENGDDEPASKKAKADSASSNREVITQAHMDAYNLYKKCKLDELKDVLRWNMQVLVGTKDAIMTKIIDGTVHGRLGRCQLCNGGKLKFNVDNAHEIVCNGDFDEATQRRITCNYTTCPSKAPRFQPWYTSEPSEEEQKVMDDLIEQAKGGGGGASGGTAGTSDDPNVDILVAAVKAKVDNDPNNADAWNLKSNKGMRSASIMVAKILLDHNSDSGGNDDLKTIDLPRDDEDKDYKNAKVKVAEVVQMNRDKTIEEMIPLLIETFGYVEDKKKKASVKQDKLAETVAVPANVPIIAALQELGEFYFKEGNRNAGGTYVKAANALSKLNYEITAENAKQLSKGKTKVAGIGKGTSDKIHEFYTTGVIAKLQEKRGDAA